MKIAWKPYNRLRLAILAFIVLVTGFLIAPVWGITVPVTTAIPLLMGALFIAIGTTLPGFRTRANRAGGRLFVVVGAAGIAATPLGGPWAVLILVLGALVGALVVTALAVRAPF